MALGSIAVDTLYREGSKEVTTFVATWKHNTDATLPGGHDVGVTSGTDHGTGDYSVTLTNAMFDSFFPQSTCATSTGPRFQNKNLDRDTSSVAPYENFNESGTLQDNSIVGGAWGTFS